MTREEILKEAGDWLLENCSRRLIKEYDATRLTDFALAQIKKREQEIVERLEEEISVSHDAWQSHESTIFRIQQIIKGEE